MNRSFVIILAVLLLALITRMTSPPRYRGTPPKQSDVSRSNAVAAPFGDDLRGSCNAFLSLLARSLRREGFLATGGIPLMNTVEAPPERFWVYDHHTPGVPCVAALAQALFGDREATARGVALLFSLFTVFLVTRTCLRELGVFGVLGAAAVLVTVPAATYWGTHLNYEVPTMPFAFLFLERVLSEQHTRAQRRVAAGALILGFWMDLLMLAVLGALWLLCLRRPGTWRRCVSWSLFGITLLLGWWLWRHVQMARAGHTGAGTLWQHLKAVTFLSPDLTVFEWLKVAPGHLSGLFAGWPVALLVAGIILSAGRAQHPSPKIRRLFWATLVVAVLNFAVPAVRSADHPFYALYFLLPVSLAAAMLSARFACCQSGRIGVGLLVCVLCSTGLVADWTRPAPSSTRPSAALLGRELSALKPKGAVVALPKTSFDLLTVNYYADRFVCHRLADDPDGRKLRSTILFLVGLEERAILVTDNHRWPSKGPFRMLTLAP